METITFKLLFIALALSFCISHSSLAQYSTNNHTALVADATEVYLNCLWYDDPNYVLAVNTFHFADNGKTLATSYPNQDNTYTGESSLLQVRNRYTIIPNPSSGKSKLKIQLKPQDSKLMLYDLTGRLQFKNSVDPGQDNVEIDVISLNKGIYILKVLAGETVVGVEKIVIN